MEDHPFWKGWLLGVIYNHPFRTSIFILFCKYVVRHGIESFPTPNQQQRPLALRIPPTRTMWSMSLVRDSNHQLCHHREARLDVGFWNNLIF